MYINQAKFPIEREKMSKNLKLNFSKIGENYEYVAPGNPSVNCIGFALNLNSRINPQTNNKLNEDPLSIMDATFLKWGYKRTAENPKQVMKKTGKIVLYAHTHSQKKVREVTHAVRQFSDGGWLSKMGDKGIIKVASLDVLSGKEYGEPVAVYDR